MEKRSTETKEKPFDDKPTLGEELGDIFGKNTRMMHLTLFCWKNSGSTMILLIQDRNYCVLLVKEKVRHDAFYVKKLVKILEKHVWHATAKVHLCVNNAQKLAILFVGKD